MLQLFKTNNIGIETAKIIQEALEREFSPLVVSKISNFSIPTGTYSNARAQYDAYGIVSEIKRMKTKKWALGVVDVDLYVKDLNFVFGVAIPGDSALVSLHRLLDDRNLIEKEAIHETGHILNLRHCEHPCVMTFSNSLFEAQLKSKHLCETCKKKVNYFLNSHIPKT